MSDAVNVQVMEGPREPPPTTVNQPYDDSRVKTYRYLRTAIVALLIGLGVAVGYQTWFQDWHLLSSVSAYYYTPAQAIFVGALIGLGACMVALKGTTPTEDVLLNLGGIFAAIVAIVPTSRGSDYRTALLACREAASQQTSNGLDCPTVRALEAATKANVQNNIFALLLVGALGLLATLLFYLLKDRRLYQGVEWDSRKFWWGFGVALAVFVLGAVAYFAFLDWLIDNAHYIAALSLFACILAVAGVNARRHQAKPNQQQGGNALQKYRYTWVALAMLAAAALGIGLWLSHVITLFWLEIAVALLFAVFWMVQTIEQWGDEAAW